MPKLRVPPRHRDSFAWLARLEEDQFESLLTQLSAAEQGLWVGATELASRVRRSVPELADEAAERFVEALISVGAGRAVHGDPLEAFVDGISRALDFDLETYERERLAQRLTALLSAPPVAATAKATDLVTEQSSIFHTARIMTDIRPVFGDDPTAPPTGGVVFHTLKIDMFRLSGAEDVYVTLTNEDLAALKRTVDRALAKNASLTSYLDSVGFTRLEAPTDE